MTNKEANNKIKRLILELEILDDEDFNARNKENIYKAKQLLEDVGVWSYDDL
jgi:hypothetical protein